ncbi:MAG: hypothetical protein N2645_23455 [Clostridia bacterium]|nr:hypothetical protein [Clostridia bacterium]
MFKTLGTVLICLLATYGAIYLLYSVLHSIYHRIKAQSSNIKLVLIVKDQEDTIEGIMREILGNETSRSLVHSKNFVVLDMGSKDETLSILKKFQRDYDYLHIIEEHEKEKVFADFKLEC